MHAGHGAAVAGTLAVAVAAAVPLSLLVRVERWVPLDVASGLRASGPGPLDGGIHWGAAVRTPARIRGGELDGLLILLVALGSAVVLACTVNLFVLLMRHFSARRRELAIRRAVGATPGQLRVELTVEAAVLLAAGLALGGAAGAGAARGLSTLLPPSLTVVGGPVPRLDVAAALALPPLAVVTVGYTVAGPRFTAGRAVVGRARSIARDLSAGLSPTRWEKGLAAVQCGLLISLLMGSGLLLRGSAGDEADAATISGAGELRTADLSPRPTRAGDRESAIRWLARELRRTFGSDAAAASSGALLGLGTVDAILCRGCRRGPMPTPVARVRPRIHAVVPGWFAALDLDVLSGDTFPRGGRRGTDPLAVVNGAFASRFGIGAAGARLQLPGRRFDDAWYRVVGVVENLQAPGLGSPGRSVPAVYLSAFRHPPSEITVVWPAGASEVGAGLGRTLARFEIGGSEPLSARLEEHRQPERRARDASLFLATAAWVSGLAGLAAVTILTLRRRWRELGIRRAVGARRRDVTAIVLGDNLRTLGIGAALGAVCGIAEARALAGYLNGTDGAVPALCYAAAVAALGASVVLATWLPVRRATRDPPRAMLSRE